MALLWNAYVAISIALCNHMTSDNLFAFIRFSSQLIRVSSSIVSFFSYLASLFIFSGSTRASRYPSRLPFYRCGVAHPPFAFPQRLPGFTPHLAVGPAMAHLCPRHSSEPHRDAGCPLHSSGETPALCSRVCVAFSGSKRASI